MAKGGIYEFEGDVVAEQLTDDFECQCPGCDGTYATGRDTSDGKPVLLHSWPYCTDFRDLDIADFLREQAVHAINKLGDSLATMCVTAMAKKTDLPN